ncbi:class I SAM-dependent methyltransferase [Flavobacterium sp.]|uniref:class I SAM-dependent DNA methyltransferase n=1 Tax=Flavobacterium sp. TaxID=239 RepID=UPI002619D4A0|nr:class I SAM-dependent methyltransferase [Flavobacterium sp.]
MPYIYEMIDAIKKYYDNLAPTYDSNRFENSYGKYIDQQERIFLKAILEKNSFKNTLDLGCGTGRFLEFADYGVDISPKMIEIAKSKFPNVAIKEGSVSNIPYPENYFDLIYSLHVIMHLDIKITEEFLAESHKKLNLKGKLIFDFPSKKRRKLINYKSTNWHAANDFSIAEIQKMTENNWKFKNFNGILFFPIHRFPTWIRPFFGKIDNFLSNSFLKEYASYIIVELEKK